MTAVRISAGIETASRKIAGRNGSSSKKDRMITKLKHENKYIPTVGNKIWVGKLSRNIFERA